MRLYHITCIAHFRKIFGTDGFLKTTESNIGMPDEFMPDPNDPTYDEPMVPVWPQTRRNKDTLPMIVPGEVLREMEKDGPIYPRAKHSDFNGPADTQQKVTMVVGHDHITPDKPALFGSHVGPDVVWLTKDPTPVQRWAAVERLPDEAEEYRKSEVLFVVDVPDEDVNKWSEWAFEQGIHPFWYDCLDSTDLFLLKQNAAEDWYVVPREIPKSEWVGIYQAKSKKALWLNPDKFDIDPENYLPNGLLDPEKAVALTEQYPAPQVYKAASLRRTT